MLHALIVCLLPICFYQCTLVVLLLAWFLLGLLGVLDCSCVGLRGGCR